jgi:hypothetical protein
LIAEGVVLEEEMIFAFEVDEAVGIVGPVFLRRKVNLRDDRADRIQMATRWIRRMKQTAR